MHISRIAKVIIAVLLAICCPRLSDAAALTLQWDPPSDGITAGYVLVYGTASHSYSGQVDVGLQTTCILNGLSGGTTYYFALRAYDATGDTSSLSDEAWGTTLLDVPSVVTGLSIASSLPSPQVLGRAVTWSSTATGGVPPYQFQWSLYQAGTWTVGPWGTASTWNWTPTAAGSDYQIRVGVRSSGSTSVSGELVQSVPYTITAPTAPQVSSVGSATLVANLASPQEAGTKIGWSAKASGGVAPYQYKWWVYDGSAWKATTAWTSSSTWNWMPTAPNDAYIVRVWVRSAGNSADAAEASASVPFPIKSAPKKPCHGPKC